MLPSDGELSEAMLAVMVLVENVIRLNQRCFNKVCCVIIEEDLMLRYIRRSWRMTSV